MNMIVASLACVALLTIAVAHLLWAFGSRWPIRDETLLARTVVGTPGVTRMPSRWRSFGLGLLTLTLAAFALALADSTSGGATMTAFGALAAFPFLVRGILGYTGAWQLRTPEEPFRSNDRRVYSPLCLLIAAGFLLLVLMRLQ